MVNKINQIRAGLAALRADKNTTKAAKYQRSADFYKSLADEKWYSTKMKHSTSTYWTAYSANQKSADYLKKRANRQYSKADRLMWYWDSANSTSSKKRAKAALKK